MSAHKDTEIMRSKELTLRQYVRAEHERLDAFAVMWKRMRDCNDDDYPAQLLPGEWDEQVAAFHYNNPL